jgi:hypothetical protein
MSSRADSHGFALEHLQQALAHCGPELDAVQTMKRLASQGLDRLPRPGSGATLLRWQALAAVARHDLALAKLYEGHTDALAILDELGVAQGRQEAIWGVWAAESPKGRAWLRSAGRSGADSLSNSARHRLDGDKFWCSGAAAVTHGLLTAWVDGESQSQLVSIDMNQPGIRVDASAWHAVGMAGSTSVDLHFEGAVAQPVGRLGHYLNRPGFWHGGAGIAACWFGGAQAIADALHRSAVEDINHEQGAKQETEQGAKPVIKPVTKQRSNDFKRAACGKVDLELRATAAMLREVAAWIDEQPLADAQAQALRARLAAEGCARRVLDEAGRAVGATPFCRDARFARAAADLPVFIRQSHAERDFAALGDHWVAAEKSAWNL